MEEITMEGHNPFLPEEIIRHILKRLPVKSLIRFQCVCKDWKNLIRTQAFITEHMHHSRNENSSLILQWDFQCDPLHLLMLNHKMQVLEVQPSPFMNSLSWTTFVGCSNGLLCVKIDGPSNLQSILVWNPATREFRQVPNPINLDGGDNYIFARGFGFSPIINDYRILISHDFPIDRGDFPLELYSLSTGSWKEIRVDDLGALYLDDFPVTVNGIFFWYGITITTDDNNDVIHADGKIVSFDIAMEEFTLIPLPFNFKSYDRVLLTVHENRIALLSSNVIGNNESSMTDLWVMEELAGGTFGERWGWSKKYSISASSSTYPRGIWWDKIVYINRELPKYGEPESVADNRMVHVLYLLNLSTNELAKFVPSQRGDRVWVIFDYVESLMPVVNIQH